MGHFIGASLGTLGIFLLGSGLVLPRDPIAVLWQLLLGLAMTVLGFVLVLSSSRNAARGLAGLLGLLGLALLGAAIIPATIGFPLYGGIGALWRGALGLIFCVCAYLIIEWGSEIFGYDDDPF